MTGALRSPLDVRLSPPPPAWEKMLGGAGLTDAQRMTRESLGLPTDRPIVMGGHQAGLWHPGILAKYIATASAARVLGAHAAWLVVDQDANEPGRIDFPAWKGDRLLRRVWHAVAPGEADVPTSLRSASAPLPLPDPAGTSARVRIGLERVRSALADSAGAGTLAEQFTSAGAELARGIAPMPTFVYASAMSNTRGFADLVARMADEPSEMSRAYNSAVAAHPGAGVRAMREGELPLWTIEDGRRRPASVTTLRENRAVLPRALLATGFARLTACDLFIHGLGGGVYEPIADAWLGAWLGSRPGAGFVVVTADLRLAIEGFEGTLPRDLARSVAHSHRAMHNPSLIGASSEAEQKRFFLDEISRVREGGGDPGPVFRKMHAMLDAYRRSHGSVLDAMSARSGRAAGLIGSATIAHARDWAFPLYPESDLLSLREEIDRRFAF